MLVQLNTYTVSAQEIETLHSITQTSENYLDLTEQGYLDVKIVYNKDNAKTLRNNLTPIMTLDMIIESTGEKIHYERIKQMGFFFVNNVLESTVEYGTNSRGRATIPSTIMQLNFSAGSGFSTYYYSGSEDWIANQIKGMAKDKAIGLLISALTGSLPAYIAGMITSAHKFASDLYDFATLGNVWSDNALRAVSVFYGSYNSQCNILAYYGAKVYLLKAAWSPNIDISSGKDFAKNAKHTWNGNPWDYTQPSACRTIVNQYPY